VMRTAYTLFRKDLLVEARTRESLTAMALFSVMAFVLFHFGLNRDSIDGDLAAGVLWVTLLLATVLAVTRLFVAEREQGGFESLLLAPIDRTAIFFGKAAALLVYLLLVEVVAIPAFDILLLRGTVLDAMPELLAVIVLADLGLAAVGALVAALDKPAPCPLAGNPHALRSVVRLGLRRRFRLPPGGLGTCCTARASALSRS
jgi:heme exporter protein B